MNTRTRRSSFVLCVAALAYACGGAQQPASTVTTTTETAPETVSAEPDLTPAEIVALPMQRVRGDTTIEQLREGWLARTHGRAHELIDQLIATQQQLEAAGDGASIDPMLAWYRDVGAAFPDDAEVQLRVADAFALLCSMMRLTNHPDHTACTETQQRAEALARDQPDAAGTHRLLGQIARHAGDSPTALRELAHCLRLDETEAACLRMYRATREAFTMPTCDQAALTARLAVFGASTVAPAGQTRPTFDYEDLHYFADATALLARADIVRATALTPEGNMLQLELTPAAFERASAWATTANAGGEASYALDVRAGRRHVATARAMGPDPEHNTIMLSGEPGTFSLTAFCASPTVATIPEGAELPASLAQPPEAAAAPAETQ